MAFKTLHGLTHNCFYNIYSKTRVPNMESPKRSMDLSESV